MVCGEGGWPPPVSLQLWPEDPVVLRGGSCLLPGREVREPSGWTYLPFSGHCVRDTESGGGQTDSREESDLGEGRGTL